MATKFGQTQIKGADYFLERLVFTGWPFAGSSASSLNAGDTTLFTLSGWNKPGSPTKQVQVTDMWGTQNSNVQVEWTVDPADQLNTANQGYMSAFPPGTRRMRSGISAVSQASLKLTNNTTAISGFQFNYATQVRRLTAVDKLKYQAAGLHDPAYDLTDQEKRALRILGKKGDGAMKAMLDLVHKGTAPFSLDQMMQHLYLNRVVQEKHDLFSLSVTSAQQTLTSYSSSLSTDKRSGRFPVLVGVSVPGGANIAVTISRDDDDKYLALNGSAFAQTDGEEWPLWLPALDHITVTYQDGPGNTSATTSPLALHVLELEMSDLIAVQYGLIEEPASVGEARWAKAIVGIA